MTMPDQIFINIAVLAVGVAIGALLGELLFREVLRFQSEKGANHEKE